MQRRYENNLFPNNRGRTFLIVNVICHGYIMYLLFIGCLNDNDDGLKVV